MSVDLSVALPPAQQAALEALLAGEPFAAAARAAGVEQRTLRRWRSEPGFAAVLREGQADRFSVAAGQLGAAVEGAIDFLRGVVSDDQHPVSARIRAAQILVGTAVEFRKVVEFEARLLAVEEKLAAEAQA